MAVYHADMTASSMRRRANSRRAAQGRRGVFWKSIHGPRPYLWGDGHGCRASPAGEKPADTDSRRAPVHDRRFRGLVSLTKRSRPMPTSPPGRWAPAGLARSRHDVVQRCRPQVSRLAPAGRAFLHPNPHRGQAHSACSRLTAWRPATPIFSCLAVGRMPRRRRIRVIVGLHGIAVDGPR